jgi:hypothetical protein
MQQFSCLSFKRQLHQLTKAPSQAYASKESFKKKKYTNYLG